MAGFVLKNTLSDNGGVTRGICKMDEDNNLTEVVETKNILLEHLYHKPLLNADEIFAELMKYKEMVAPYVGDVSLFLWNALKEGKEILLEGQLGSLKDPDHGIYPMVTSSSTLAAYGAIGAGVPPYEIKKVITVCKAYSSAVGAGAFVSEIFGEEADELRRRGGDGGEYGATTGRPRRMGWFDCVASKYGCRLQGATDVAFTVLDVLGYLDEIPVCVGYDIDGEVTTDFPTTYLLENGQIKTTVTRAKEIKPLAEKMITLGKKGDLAAYRQAMAFITREDVCKKTFKELAPAYAERNGGYTRIVRTGVRRGDAAETAIIELV